MEGEVIYAKNGIPGQTYITAKSNNLVEFINYDKTKDSVRVQGLETRNIVVVPASYLLRITSVQKKEVRIMKNITKKTSIASYAKPLPNDLKQLMKLRVNYYSRRWSAKDADKSAWDKRLASVKSAIATLQAKKTAPVKKAPAVKPTDVNKKA